MSDVRRAGSSVVFIPPNIDKVSMHVAHRPPKSRFKLIFCSNMQP